MNSTVKISRRPSIASTTIPGLKEVKYMGEYKDTLQEIDLERSKYLISLDDMLEEMVS